MTCKHGNTVRNEEGEIVPCGTETFDADGKMKICGECAHDQRMYWKGMAP
jgi:hypothetical protein